MRTARDLMALLLSALTASLIPGGAGADPPKVAGKVIAVAGPVSVTRPEVPSRPLRFRDDLYWRDVVEARKDGMARVLLGGKATVIVRELSSLELRDEKRIEGVCYVVDLVSGKVRASVARMLMQRGEQVEVWTWNSVASVRGTDFIVESVERPAHAGAFKLLGAREVAQAVADGRSRTSETVVVTLSGLVEVSNRLAGTGHVERVAAYEAVRVSGIQDPVRFHVGAGELRIFLQGLTPPRPPEARSADKAEAVGKKVEGAALATSAQSVGVVEQAGRDAPRQGAGKGADERKQSGSPPGGQNSQGGGDGDGNGIALGQVKAAGDGNGLTPDQANLAKDVKRAKDVGKRKDIGKGKK